MDKSCFSAPDDRILEESAEKGPEKSTQEVTPELMVLNGTVRRHLQRANKEIHSVDNIRTDRKPDYK